MRTQRVVEFLAAAAVGAAVISLAVFGIWPFDSRPRVVSEVPSPSIVQFFLADRIALGFVRLAVTAVAGFIVASVAALLVAGRWLRVFGAGGLAVDDRMRVDRALGDLKDQLDEMQRERDEIRAEYDDFRKDVHESLQERYNRTDE